MDQTPTQNITPLLETDTAEYWRDLYKQLEMELGGTKQALTHLNDQIEDLSLNLEIANERWVTSVNAHAVSEVALRKLQKKVN